MIGGRDAGWGKDRRAGTPDAVLSRWRPISAPIRPTYRLHAIIMLVIAGAGFFDPLDDLVHPQASRARSPTSEAALHGRRGPRRRDYTAFWAWLASRPAPYRLLSSPSRPESRPALDQLRPPAPAAPSAVIFALRRQCPIATSFLHRAAHRCAARLCLKGGAGWFVFWGYNLFIIAGPRPAMCSARPKARNMPSWNGMSICG